MHEVIKGTRINWDQTQKELGQTLQNLQSLEARAEAMREVGARLIAKGQGAVAPVVWPANWRRPIPGEIPEMQALIGLQMVAAGQEAGPWPRRRWRLTNRLPLPRQRGPQSAGRRLPRR